jgi:hypothetical protein
MTAECEQFFTNDKHLAKAAGHQLEVWDWTLIGQASGKRARP